MTVAPLVSSELHVGYPLRLGAGAARLEPEGWPTDLLARSERDGEDDLAQDALGSAAGPRGRVEIEGTEVSELSPRRRAQLLAVVLTDRVTVGMLDVRTLVSLGRQPHTDWRGRLSATDSRVVDDAIFAAGVDDLAARNIAELSDGERQRVMLARALAQERACSSSTRSRRFSTCRIGFR